MKRFVFVHQRKLSLLPQPKKAAAVFFVGESSNSCKRRFPPPSTSHFSLVNQPWIFCLWKNLSNVITLNYEKMCDLKVGVASCIGQMSWCILLAKTCALIWCCCLGFLGVFSKSWNCCGRQKEGPDFWVLQSFISWGVGVFLYIFVSQSQGAVQTWMEHGGFPGGLEGLDPCCFFPGEFV